MLFRSLADRAEMLADRVDYYDEYKYRAAQALHQTASSLYYLAKREGRRGRGGMDIMDHTGDRLLTSFARVSRAYRMVLDEFDGFSRFRYRSSLRSIKHTYKRLVYVMSGFRRSTGDFDMIEEM